MKTYTIIVLMSPTLGILCDGDCESTNADVPLSRDAGITERPPNISKQSHTLKVHSHTSKLQPQRQHITMQKLSEKVFPTFMRAISAMKSRMDQLLDTLPIKNHYTSLTDGIENDVALPDNFQAIVDLFKKPEQKLGIAKKYAAGEKMKQNFYLVYALLSRHTNPRYQTVLSRADLNNTSAVAAELLKLHGPTKSNDNWKKLIFQKFSASITRTRHACNSIYHHFLYLDFLIVAETMKKLKNRNVTIPEVLSNVGFLEAWNVTKEDIDNVNILIKVLTPRNPIISTAPFNFEDEKGISVHGILPYYMEWNNITTSSP